MNYYCLNCNKKVPSNQVNLEDNFAFCPYCNEAFEIPSRPKKKDFVVDISVLEHPPEGAWFRNEPSRIVIGATLKNPIGYFLAIFALFFSIGSFNNMYISQFLAGKFDFFQSLFGIPFVLASVLFCCMALMSIWGKVEVIIGDNCYIFVGVGKYGWTRPFDLLDIESVEETKLKNNNSNGYYKSIVIEGSKRIVFGTGLRNDRRLFMIDALKYIVNETKPIEESN